MWRIFLNNIRVFVLSLKKAILPLIFLFFTICLLVFSNNNLTATKQGLLLWANSLVPALFPFLVATELLKNTPIVNFIGKLLNKLMRPLFNVPGIGAFALIMGILSGYPIGAKIVAEFYEQGLCSKAECERLLSFTNNSGPLFIIGTVGIALFYNSMIGILLFCTHVISGILVGLLFRFWKRNESNTANEYKTNYMKDSNITFSSLGEILSNSIMNSIHSIFLIGGFVVLFCVVISILNTSGAIDLFAYFITPVFNFLHIDINFVKPFICGIIELTNGLNSITNISTKSISTTIVFASFLLGFGGISVLLQVFSLISKVHLPIKTYLIGKILHGTISAILTYFTIRMFPIFNLDITPIFSQNVNAINNISSNSNFTSFFIILFIFIISSILIKRKRYSH